MNIDFLKNKKKSKKDDKESEINWSKPVDVGVEKNNILPNIFNIFNFRKKHSVDLIDLKKRRKTILNDIKKEKEDKREVENKKDHEINIGENIIKKADIPNKKKKDKKINNNFFYNYVKKYLSKVKKTRKDFYKTKDEIIKKDVVEKKKEEKPEEIKEEKKWEKVNTLNTNLIKDQVYVYFDWQINGIYLMIGVLLSSIIISGVYFGLSYIEEGKYSDNREYTQEINDLKSKITTAETEMKKIEKFGLQINLVKETLKNHIYWTNFFAFLEKNTLPNVYYSGFSGDTGGIYNLSTRVDNFEMINNQILQFKNNKNILEVSTEQGTRAINSDTNKSTVSFNLDIKLDPKIFNQ